MGRTRRCRAPQPHPLAFSAGAGGRALRQGASHGHHVAAGGRTAARLLRLLLLHRQPRPQGQIGRDRAAGTPPAAADPGRRPHRVGPGRHTDAALRAQGRRRRPASQPDLGARRSQVCLRAHLGDARLGRAASALAYHRLAAAGLVVHQGQGRAEAPQALWLVVPDQAGASGGLGPVGGGKAAAAGQADLVGGRRRLRVPEVDPAGCGRPR